MTNHAKTLAGQSDPTIAAFRAWLEAARATNEWEAQHAKSGKDMPVTLHEVQHAAMVRLASVTATTPEGLVGQILCAFDAFGYCRAGGRFDDPDAYEFDNQRDDADGALLRQILAGARGLCRHDSGALEAHGEHAAPLEEARKIIASD
ncbi:hypothetical protein H0I76_15720 [Limibaculum sp. M0105]|uniref:Uncharacterized protein n=1 Tax=Thermohalobaculum xanthum TaxID=2753746 RepID=A0A8J7SHB4_9RHOB|nr:hypothetical protein [Thermohalobaculum xanthum]MBK0400647.1 hypothetical protein [Thermohalobaculum xanthum]